eukprot:2416299-Rhodomonas_salina.1
MPVRALEAGPQAPSCPRLSDSEPARARLSLSVCQCLQPPSHRVSRSARRALLAGTPAQALTLSLRLVSLSLFSSEFCDSGWSLPAWAVEHEQAGTGSYHTRYLVPIARNHDDPGDLARSRSRYPGYPPADTLTFITT